MKKIILSLLLMTLPSVYTAAETVKLETDLGEITITLFHKEAPKSVENFLEYVDDGYYNGTIFHRVIPGFMVQGGGLTFDFTEKETRDPVVNESSNGLINARGTLAMARFSDPDSATSQFFINLSNNPHLDSYPNRPGYTVFGQVIEGMAIVDEISIQPPGGIRRYPNAPAESIRILKAYRIEDPAPKENVKPEATQNLNSEPETNSPT
jgi:cyclophilin family peptidyl-prolyl cis-trans isomerase